MNGIVFPFSSTSNANARASAGMIAPSFTNTIVPMTMPAKKYAQLLSLVNDEDVILS